MVLGTGISLWGLCVVSLCSCVARPQVDVMKRDLGRKTTAVKDKLGKLASKAKADHTAALAAAAAAASAAAASSSSSSSKHPLAAAKKVGSDLGVLFAHVVCLLSCSDC